MSSIGNQALENLKENSDISYGENTKKVRISLVAYTKVEYSEEIEVPVEFDDNDLNALALAASDMADGSGQYVPDNEYWDKDHPVATLVN